MAGGPKINMEMTPKEAAGEALLYLMGLAGGMFMSWLYSVLSNLWRTGGPGTRTFLGACAAGIVAVLVAIWTAEGEWVNEVKLNHHMQSCIRIAGSFLAASLSSAKGKFNDYKNSAIIFFTVFAQVIGGQLKVWVFGIVIAAIIYAMFTMELGTPMVRLAHGIFLISSQFLLTQFLLVAGWSATVDNKLLRLAFLVLMALFTATHCTLSYSVLLYIYVGESPCTFIDYITGSEVLDAYTAWAKWGNETTVRLVWGGWSVAFGVAHILFLRSGTMAGWLGLGP